MSDAIGRPAKQFTFNYFDLAKISGLSYNVVRQHMTRKFFDPENLESIVLWLARYGREELRMEIIHRSLSPEIGKSGPKKKKVVKRASAKE